MGVLAPKLRPPPVPVPAPKGVPFPLPLAPVPAVPLRVDEKPVTSGKALPKTDPVLGAAGVLPLVTALSEVEATSDVVAVGPGGLGLGAVSEMVAKGLKVVVGFEGSSEPGRRALTILVEGSGPKVARLGHRCEGRCHISFCTDSWAF